MKTLLVLLVTLGSGCAAVAKNHRQYLGHPTMPAADDPLEEHARGKFHATREAAAGGDGKPAGGGCACGN